MLRIPDHFFANDVVRPCRVAWTCSVLATVKPSKVSYIDAMVCL